MTTGELLELLKNYPADTPIRVSDGSDYPRPLAIYDNHEYLGDGEKEEPLEVIFDTD